MFSFWNFRFWNLHRFGNVYNTPWLMLHQEGMIDFVGWTGCTWEISVPVVLICTGNWIIYPWQVCRTLHYGADGGISGIDHANARGDKRCQPDYWTPPCQLLPAGITDVTSCVTVTTGTGKSASSVRFSNLTCLSSKMLRLWAGACKVIVCFHESQLQVMWAWVMENLPSWWNRQSHHDGVVFSLCVASSDSWLHPLKQCAHHSGTYSFDILQNWVDLMEQTFIMW